MYCQMCKSAGRYKFGFLIQTDLRDIVGSVAGQYSKVSIVVKLFVSKVSIVVKLIVSKVSIVVKLIVSKVSIVVKLIIRTHWPPSV